MLQFGDCKEIVDKLGASDYLIHGIFGKFLHIFWQFLGQHQKFQVGHYSLIVISNVMAHEIIVEFCSFEFLSISLFNDYSICKVMDDSLIACCIPLIVFSGRSTYQTNDFTSIFFSQYNFKIFCTAFFFKFLL